MTENQNDNEKEMKETKVDAPRHIVFNAKSGIYFGKGQTL
jgi:hypothetical protein